MIRWPLSLKVTLQIFPDHVASDTTVGLVALRLVHIGGSFVGWKPNFYDLPAQALFEFETPNQRDWFIAQAVEIPGVSVAAE